METPDPRAGKRFTSVLPVKLKTDHRHEATPDTREQPPSRARASAGALSDEELVQRARNDDTIAVEALVARYQKKAFAIAFHMSDGDRQAALDLTQEAFLKTFKNFRKFKGDASFYTWFYRILVNTCLDGRRRKLRRERLFGVWRSKSPKSKEPREEIDVNPEGEETRDPLQFLLGKQLSRDIDNALSLLPERQRTVFQLKVLHEMTLQEISQTMDVAVGTVKSHLFRATQFMRKTLEDWQVP